MVHSSSEDDNTFQTSASTHTTGRGTLASLELGPLTAAQLLTLSHTWAVPFTSHRRILDRLHLLREAGRIQHRWYARAERGGGLGYYQLSLLGYRLLCGDDQAKPPTKHFFADVPVALHHHKRALMDVVVHLLVSAHRHGMALLSYCAENELSIAVGSERLAPDATLVFLTPSRREYRFYVEMDMSTITLRSQRSDATIERRLLLYDLNRSMANEPHSVLFFTPSIERRDHILARAAEIVSNPARSLFFGATTAEFLAADDAFTTTCFRDHRKAIQALVPTRVFVLPPKVLA